MNTKESFHCILKPVIFIDSVYKKMNTIILKRVLEKCHFNKDIETYSNKIYYLEPDEEYRFIFRNKKKNIINLFFDKLDIFFYFFELGLKSGPGSPIYNY